MKEEEVNIYVKWAIGQTIGTIAALVVSMFLAEILQMTPFWAYWAYLIGIVIVGLLSAVPSMLCGKWEHYAMCPTFLAIAATEAAFCLALKEPFYIILPILAVLAAIAVCKGRVDVIEERTRLKEWAIFLAMVVEFAFVFMVMAICISAIW